MIDECEGCVKQVFADNWVDFINDYLLKHPDFYYEYRAFKKKQKKKVKEK